MSGWSKIRVRNVIAMLQERVWEMKTAKRAILVLGMHRSGTSALARTVNLLGAAAPQTLMDASADNERGYWESEPLVHLSDEAMAACGRSWRSTGAIRMSAMAGAGDLRRRLRGAIASEFGDASTIMLKDPRVTRLMPLYREVLSEAGYEILPVIALRNPVEVVKSLGRRDGMQSRHALGLWLRYTLDAERETRGMPRAVVVYEDLLSDWRKVTDVMKRQLGGYWPEPTREVAAEVDAFLTSDLRHYAHALPSGLFGRAALAGQLYREMAKLVTNPVAVLPRSLILRANIELMMR